MHTYDFSLKSFLLSKNHIFTLPTYKSTGLNHECHIWVANMEVFSSQICEKLGLNAQKYLHFSK